MVCQLLKGRLLGEKNGLQPYYFLKNNEEVAVINLMANVNTPVSSGFSNTRLNIVMLMEGEIEFEVGNVNLRSYRRPNG